MRRTQIYLNEDQDLALSDRARAAGRTKSELIRDALDAFLAPSDGMATDLTWIDEPASRRAGELGRQYRRSHPGLGVADLIIAATTLILAADLATGNGRHFPMSPTSKSPTRLTGARRARTSCGPVAPCTRRVEPLS